MRTQSLRRCTTVAVVLAALVTTTARADLYEFTFSGEVTSIDGVLPAFWSDVELGSPWEVTYLIDSDAPDKGGGAFAGRYLAESATVSLAGVGITTDVAEVLVDILPPFQDYEVWLFDLPIVDGTAAAVKLTTLDDVFENDDLPLSLDLDDFPIRQFELGIPFHGFVRGNVLSFSGHVVPTPPGAIALLALFCRSRRRRAV